jgi:hypothetical protein
MEDAMVRPTALPSTGERENDRRRRSPFRIWLLCAIPWLALVGALSIYDHHRAIGRTAAAHFESVTAEPALAAIQWLLAAAQYSGGTIAFYGVLPLGIAFVLFVLFLPWAVPWAQSGEYED